MKLVEERIVITMGQGWKLNKTEKTKTMETTGANCGNSEWGYCARGNWVPTEGRIYKEMKKMGVKVEYEGDKKRKGHSTG